MNTTTHTHDVIVLGCGAAAVSAIRCAQDSGLDAKVVPFSPSRIDLLHRPFRVWDGGRELRSHAVVIAVGEGSLPPVYRDWLAHDRQGRLITADDSSRTNIDGVFAAGCEAACDARRWLGMAEAA
jgi:hypothetical protein